MTRDSKNSGESKMILVDTTVIIDLWKGKDGARKCLENNKPEIFAISSITLEEIYDGLGYTKVKKPKKVYEEIKDQHEKILSEFQNIPITQDILRKVGLKRGELRARGSAMDIEDLIIMITAQEMGATKIITRNPRHFENPIVPIEIYEI